MARDAAYSPPKLNDQMRHFAVVLFARFHTPRQVVDALREEFGVEVTRQSACAYSPKHKRDLSAKWRAVHEAAREKYLAAVSEVGIAHKVYRLEALQKTLDRAQEQGDSATVLQTLEQAAKERGDFYTNRHNIHATGSLIDDLLKAVAGGRGADDDRDDHEPRRLRAVGAGGAA